MTVHPFRAADIGPVGQSLRQSGTSDVVDAHVLVVAVRLGLDVTTADADDFVALSGHLGRDAPAVRC